MAKMKRTKSAAPVIRKSRGDKFASWMFLVPTMIFLGITALLPLLYSLYLSFFQVETEPAECGAGIHRIRQLYQDVQ